ncbi:hypothetical protein RRG08_050333 [Elysia crispata]|uniref:Uncharacterized protein n=1 Tax=Elysia crispata TaxID=231223 RepID=A0AAE1DPY6_9GAST|nr:hypothetical protein RRG08_050333 [Elysia crispata]
MTPPPRALADSEPEVEQFLGDLHPFSRISLDSVCTHGNRNGGDKSALTLCTQQVPVTQAGWLSRPSACLTSGRRVHTVTVWDRTRTQTLLTTCYTSFDESEKLKTPKPLRHVWLSSTNLITEQVTSRSISEIIKWTRSINFQE